MQWRSARIWGTLFPMLVATIVAGCDPEEVTTGPRIASIQIVSGNSQTGPIGGQLANPLVVRVLDQRDQPIAGAVVEFDAAVGGATLTPSADTSDADGYAQAVVRLGATIGVQTIQASLPGLNPVSFTLNATTAPASKLVISGGDTQTGQVGAQLGNELEVTVTDAFNNPKASIPVSFAIASGGGALSASVVLTDATGKAKVKWTLGTAAGTQSISATIPAVAPVTFTATAEPGLANRIVVVSGAGQTGAPNSTLPDSVVIRVVDQYGNGVSGVTVGWNTATGNGAVSPTSTVTNATGRTAARWTLGDRSGEMTLVATADQLSTPISGAAFIVFSTITAGGRHSCGIDDGGIAYCWGFDGDGQLGINGPTGAGPIYTTPQAIAPITNQTFAQINGGLYHNCGVTFSHVGYCWGNNNNGQLGNEPIVRSLPVPTLIDVSIPFSTISSGRVHSCGLSNGGRMYCWGDNERGQLAANVKFDSTTSPGTTFITYVSSPLPLEVGVSNPQPGPYYFGPWDWSAVAVGGVHTCGVRQTGTPYCWGLGREGQLGNGTNTVNNHFPQLVNFGAAVDSITAGYKHSCARNAATGAVRCWGDNTDGQLGNGGAASSNVPVTVAGSISFVAISAGYSHTCGIASGGTAYCWGKNNLGQLGDGTTTSASSPVQVAGGLVFKTLTAGDFHTCGVTTSGVAYCWGDNEYGSVGDGTLAARSTPTKVRYQQ